MLDEEQCCFSSSWESGEGLRFVNPILFPPPFLSFCYDGRVFLFSFVVGLYHLLNQNERNSQPAGNSGGRVERTRGLWESSLCVFFFFLITLRKSNVQLRLLRALNNPVFAIVVSACVLSVCMYVEVSTAMLSFFPPTTGAN